MFEIICISKVISAGYMTDINSHVELPAPSCRPGTTKPARGDTPVAVGEFKVNGITGLWFCGKRGSRGESAARSEQLPEEGSGKDGMLAYGCCVRSKKAGRKKTPFAFKNYICSFSPPQTSNKSLQKY